MLLLERVGLKTCHLKVDFFFFLNLFFSFIFLSKCSVTETIKKKYFKWEKNDWHVVRARVIA